MNPATSVSDRRSAVSGNGDVRRRPAASRRRRPVPQRAAHRLQPRGRPRRRCRRRSTRCEAQLGQTYPLVIDGEAVDDAGDDRLAQPVAHVARSSARARKATPDHAEQAIAAAKAAFPAWRDTDAGGAGRVPASRPPTVMRERRFELAAWRSTSAASRGARPTPTSPRRSTSASTTPARCCAWPTPQRRDVPGEENDYFYEPRGVAVVIAPWNFPLAILRGMTDGGAGHRQHRHHEAGRAVVGHRAPS